MISYIITALASAILGFIFGYICCAIMVMSRDPKD